MAIVIKHQGNPGVDAVAAYGGGNGKRRAQDRSQASSAMTQEMLQSHAMAQRSHDKQVANAAGADAIKPRAENGATAAGGNVNPQGIDASSVDPRVAAGLGTPGKTWTDADGNTWTNDRYGVPKVALKNNSGVDIEQEKMDRKEYDYKEGMDRREFDYKQNAERVAAREKFDYETLQKKQEDSYYYDYTDQQRQRFDQLNQAADEVRNSGEFKAGSPEQMDALSQIEKLQDEIRPTRRLKEKKQDPWALAQSKIFTDPVSGNRGFIKANGDLEFIKQEPDPAVQQADKQKAEFVSLYEKIATEPFKETKIVDIAGKMMPTTVERPKTDEEIKAEVARAIKIKQDAEAYFNPDAAAPTGKFVDANGDTSYVGEAGLAIQKKERLFMTLRSMDQRKLSPEAKAVLNLGEDRFYAAAQEKANARGISVNEYISIVMKGLTQ